MGLTLEFRIVKLLCLLGILVKLSIVLTDAFHLWNVIIKLLPIMMVGTINVNEFFILKKILLNIEWIWGIKQLDFPVLVNYGCVSPYHCDYEKQIYNMVNRCKACSKNLDWSYFSKLPLHPKSLIKYGLFER